MKIVEFMNPTGIALDPEYNTIIVSSQNPGSASE